MNGWDATQEKSIDTREWYDFVGLLADSLPGVHLGGLAATRTLLAMCDLDATSRVLDVGCGPGITACLVAGEYGSRVHGIDLSEVMIAKAKGRAERQGVADRVAFRVADVCDLPFERDSFDAIIFESVLTAVPGDENQAMAEMVRVLRPGGRMAANESTFDPAAPPELLNLLAEHPAIHRYFTAGALRRLFEEWGLQVTYLNETKSVDAPSSLKQMGCRGLLSFLVRAYPKVLLKLLRDARFRQAGKVDDAITKGGKEYVGYTLIVAWKAS